MSFWIALVSDGKGFPSSTRFGNLVVSGFICVIVLLLVFMTPFLIQMHPDKEFIANANTATLTQVLFTIVQLCGILGVLQGANYAINKTSDSSVEKAKMNPDPVPPPKPEKPGPTVVMNVGPTVPKPGSEEDITVKDAVINAEGDVNVIK